MTTMPLPTTLLLAALLAGRAGADGVELSRFAKYTRFGPAAPVYLVSSGRTLHRFFDTSPISPSGKSLALFRLPYEDCSPKAGDAGEVVIVDLKSGRERVIASSRGWEVQVGANVQWGRSDEELYFNDVDVRTWKAFAVCLNPATGSRRTLEGTVFMVSPDGTMLASHNLVKSRNVQPGYGVVIPADRVGKNIGPVADDGVYLTDTLSGRARMLVSLETIYQTAVPSIRVEKPEDWHYYCFQTKWNRASTRLLTAVMAMPAGGGKRRMAVITMKADGTEIRTAVTPDQWARGGHHINWCPDGNRLSMNLNVDEDRAPELVTMNYDGSDLRVVFEPGSGHPSFHPGGRWIITDAYPGEPVAAGDGTVPIRLIDARAGSCRDVARIFVSAVRGEFRVDPHPAWDPSGRYVVFNGLADNTRRVYIADVRPE